MNFENSQGIGGLLVIDSSWTYEMIHQRGTEDSVLCRDLGGFFDHVWTVHPFASMLNSPQWSPRFGMPVWHQLSKRHTFIEGKVGRSSWLQHCFVCNFFWSQLALLLTLRSLIRRYNIKAIRAGDPLYAGLFGWILARLTRVPLVVRVPSNNDKIRQETGQIIYPKLFRWMYVEKITERFIFRKADLVAGANSDNLQFALDNGASLNKSTLFRYGNLIARQHLVVPEERIVEEKLLNELKVEKGKFLLCIARLDPVKAVDDTIRVLAKVRESGIDVKLLIVGDGRMAPELQNLAEKLGVAQWLVMPGNQPQSVLAQLIVAAATVLSPHTGRALTEAAFGSAPIVAYDIDWQRELIETGQTGELVAFRDVTGMATGTVRMLENRSYALVMGAAVRARAIDLLDPERLNDHERASYRALITRTSAKT